MNIELEPIEAEFIFNTLANLKVSLANADPRLMQVGQNCLVKIKTALDAEHPGPPPPSVDDAKPPFASAARGKKPRSPRKR